MHARRAKLIRRATMIYLKWKGIDPFSPQGAKIQTTLYRRAKRQWAREKVIRYEEISEGLV